VRWIKFTTVALSLPLCGLAAAQGPAPVYGPQIFERGGGDSDHYVETFDLQAEGDSVLFVLNGDEEATRVSGGTIALNGDVVVSQPELNEQTEELRRPVRLRAGTNELSVELLGAPGSFISLVIAPPGPAQRFIHGRLLLPWGRNDSERAVALALKNGSPRFARVVRVVCFNPLGEVVAASPRFLLPSRASRAFALEELIETGAWEAGSIEIYYAGRGTARLFGTARHWSLPLGDAEIQDLTSAGAHILRPGPQTREEWVDRLLRR
jgi:hypothetical protein